MKSYWPYLMICEKGKTACVKESVTVHHTCKECGAESFSYPEKSEKLCYFKPSEAGSSFNTKESVPHLTQNKVSIKRSIAELRTKKYQFHNRKKKKNSTICGKMLKECSDTTYITH